MTENPATEQKVKEQDKSTFDYPSEEQMREVYEAYKSGKPGAIADVLRRRQQERQDAEKRKQER